MLSIKNIDDVLDIIGYEEFNIGGTAETDITGDFIKVFDPNTDFSVIKRKINSKINLRKKIVDNGVSYVEFNDKTYINGDRVTLDILVEQGDMGFGTNIKIMTKTVEHNINGEVKKFLSFGAKKEYLERLG